MPTSLDMGFADMMKTLKEFIVGVPDSEPGFELPIEKVDSITLAGNTVATRLIWFGHSAFLVQMDGLNILIDPMFGKVPAPHPWLGKNRYSKELPIEIEQLPAIDLIIISHDHYDHLDYGSIHALSAATWQKSISSCCPRQTKPKSQDVSQCPKRAFSLRISKP